MNSPSQIHTLFDYSQRRRPHQTDLPASWIQTSTLTRDHGQIIWQDLQPGDFAHAIEEEVARAQARGADMLEWKLYSHDEPAGLREALMAQGFEEQPVEDILFRRSDPGPISRVPGLEVVRVTTYDQAEKCFNLALQAFGNNWDKSPEDLLKRALTSEPFWLGLYEGHGVSMGRLSLTKGSAFGGLYGGASHPDFRRRGFYRPVVQARMAHAAAHGLAYVFSESLPTSQPILRALGFETLGYVQGFLRLFPT